MLIRLYLLLLLMFSLGTLHSQTERVRFEHLGATEGLENHDIQDLLQDKRGFIWIATLAGLHRFDGYTSKVFTHQPNQATSLSSNLTYALYEDKENNIWIGTRHGLNQFNPTTETFKAWKNFQGKDVLENRTIRHIFDDGRGYLWLSVSNEGILRFNKKEEKFDLQYKHIPNMPNSLPSNLVKFVYKDRKENWWVGTDNGLALFFPHLGEFFTFQYNPNNPFSLVNDLVKCIYEDKRGNLWIGTDGGISLIDLQILPHFDIFSKIQVDFINFVQEEGNPKSLISNLVKTIAQDKEGNIWIGTDGGLSKFILPKDDNPEDLWAEKIFDNYTHDIDVETSLLNNYCKKLLIDQQGIIWIGTAAGMSKYDPHRSYFHAYTHEKFNTNSLHDNFVRAVAVSYENPSTQQGELLWVGTHSGLSCYNKKTDTWKLYTNKEGLPNNYVKTLLVDENTLWIGTDKGLAKMNLVSKKIQTYYNYTTDNQLPDNGIICLRKSQNGSIYVGTWKGLAVYLPEKDEFQPILAKLKDRINDVLEDKDGDIWVAYREGLFCISAQTGKVLHYNESSVISLESSHVLSLYQDSKQRIWVGTASGGLYVFNKKQPRFHKVLSEDNGLLNNNILAITESQDQTLWFTTDKSLTRYQPQKGFVRNYTAADGLQNGGFNHLALLQKTDGEMIVGGMKGINTFFPTNIKDNLYNAPIFITDCKIYQKSIEIGEQKRLQKHISYQTQLVLTQADRMVTFEFVSLNYRNPQQNMYRYKLENFDENWNYTNAKNRQAIYTNLPAGNYKFVVEASNNDGYWSENRATLYVIVQPPFWKTWWFVALLITAAIGCLLLFIRWREQQHRRIKEKLEKEVQERTAQLMARTKELENANMEINVHLEEIATQRDEIEAQRSNVEKVNAYLEESIAQRTLELQEAIKELNSFLYSAAHDLKAPVARLEGLAHLGKLEAHEVSSLDYFDKIEDLSKEMTKLISRMIQIHNIKTKEITPQRIYFDELIDEILYEIVKTKPISHIKIHTRIDKHLHVETDLALLKVVLSNLLNNAIDYQPQYTNTHAAKIQIDIQPIRIITPKDYTVQINIIDNGIGFESSVRDKIFDMFFKGSLQSKGIGLGLYEAKLAVNRLGGEIGYDLQPQQTTFWVRL
jgi:ligand-binding sensor domain-containing protein/signal transduction histidine kinase